MAYETRVCPTCGTEKEFYVPEEYPKHVNGQIVNSKEEEEALTRDPTGVHPE
jgi:hypothetical protein